MTYEDFMHGPCKHPLKRSSFRTSLTLLNLETPTELAYRWRRELLDQLIADLDEMLAA